MIQVPRKIFSITELFQNLPNVIPQIHSPSIQMLPIVCAYFTHKQFREQRELALCEKWKYWWQLLLSGEAINNEKTVFEIIIKFAKWICANDPSVPKNFAQRLQGYFKFWQTIFEGPLHSNFAHCLHLFLMQFKEQRELALCEKWKYWWPLLLPSNQWENS